MAGLPIGRVEAELGLPCAQTALEGRGGRSTAEAEPAFPEIDGPVKAQRGRRRQQGEHEQEGGFHERESWVRNGSIRRSTPSRRTRWWRKAAPAWRTTRASSSQPSLPWMNFTTASIGALSLSCGSTDKCGQGTRP